MHMSKLSTLLKEARAQSGLTQEQLAKKAANGLTANDVSRAERALDVPTDAQLKAIAKAHNCHPAIICLKWAIQRGQLPIPFSVHNYEANLRAAVTEKLTEEEMATIATLERGNRLVKGQVFLWPGAKDWHDLWDEDGAIVSCTDC
jgi:diketogulonate reductase-like aldo/keto reductase